MIDRSRPLSFRFDGRSLSGFAGDTLASALIANGVSTVGRSFKLHRPRGILGAGAEEPNALVELRSGDRREPNVKATVAELYDGLDASSQNRWPSLRFDLLAVNGLLKPVFAAGFYYKTFMWPAAFWEKVYEPLIRRAAGLGRASGLPDPDRYERVFAACDLLVVGGGPAGLMATLTAGRAGADVILVDEDHRPGGRLLADGVSAGGMDGPALAAQLVGEIRSLPNVRVLSRTTAAAAFDHGTFIAVERVADHLPLPQPEMPRQRVWEIVAERTVLATGASERPLVFADNDRPGVMLAGGVSQYVNRHAVSPGRRVVVATATDAGWATARDLVRAGVNVAAVVDARGSAPRGFEDVAAEVAVFPAARVDRTLGRGKVEAVAIAQAGGTVEVPADLVAVSGGFNPAIQLISHFGVRPTWEPAIGGFVIGGPVHGIHPAGAAAGRYDLAACLADGARAAVAALSEIGRTAAMPDLPSIEPGPHAAGTAFWKPGTLRPGRAFVDLQHDVTAADVDLAHREGYVSVEHLKRYTTLGMATDQGRTSNVDGLAIMAALRGLPIADAGVTLSRPPVVPLSIGAVAGARTGHHFRPTRLTPIHAWAEEQGAVFVDTGQWKRPQYFPRPGETSWLDTVNREVMAVRSGVGVTDVSTLGKIEIHGPDAAAFLDRVYANRPSRIPVGRSRYALMLREDGFVMDDGTVARFAEDRFAASVSTAHAAAVWRHMLFCQQVLWPDLDVSLAAVTDVWAQFAIAGPKSARVVAALVDDGDPVSRESFGPMTARELTVCGGISARLAAVSFSGERAFELAVPASAGDAVVRRIMRAGDEHGIVAYGTEAMAVMRIEKGHPAGAELNGQTTAHDLGFAKMLARDKDHVGRVLSQRPALNDPARPRLVGLKPVDPSTPLKGGAHVLPAGAAATADNDQGWVTSSAYSPTLASHIALALVTRGPERHGEVVQVWDGIRGSVVQATIAAPCHLDPEGERLHAG
nr:sarcosine oxidase subunit alpha family protein [Chthonobacter albigriseus]